MVAFVGPNAATPLASSASRFVTGTTPRPNDVPRAVARRSAAPTMTVLDGLDTISQSSYTFSRFILGPFQPTVLSPNSSPDEREDAIRIAYRHVFGNAYIMEEEREELEIAESQFKLGAITAREFVRALAKSSTYKTRFFEGASQYRFVELNFMHLLGRAPDSQAEVSEHIRRYIAEGVDADIDSYIDSEEYSSVFGEDNIPFLRFRGAYTPCDSFNKQCALKGGWANSDKAMGGAALSGYNGSDGRQMCDRIAAYATDATTPYEEVAANTPLKTTAPNWYAIPDPALAPAPAFVTSAEVRALSERVAQLQALYDAEIEKVDSQSKDALAPFRSMVDEMAPMLKRGFSYPADPILGYPEAKTTDDISPLAEGGCKVSDYKRFHSQMELSTVSRLEKDLEEAKAQLRVYEKAASSLPVYPAIQLPGVLAESVSSVSIEASEARPRVVVSPRSSKPKPTPVEKEGIKLGPVSLPKIEVPKVQLPKNPFSK